MTPEELERLLRATPDGEGPAVDDGALRALRGGALEPAEADALAARVAAHADSRALLAAYTEEGPEDRAWMAATRAVRARRRARWAAGAVITAAAAAALVVLTIAPSAPPYALDGPFGGIALDRGEATHGPVFGARSRLRVFARPEGARRADVGCRAFVRRPGGPLRPILDGLTYAESGVCRLDLPAARLFPGPGHWEVALALGPLDADPEGRSVRLLIFSAEFRPQEVP